MSFQSTTATVLKQSGDLINETSALDSNVSSGWKEVMDYSSLTGIFASDPTADAELLVEESIDGETVDRSQTLTPSQVGSSTPFEIPIVTNYVRVTVNVTGDPSNVRALVYMSRRASSITQT